MKISEYIEALQSIQKTEGDLEVVTHRPGQGGGSLGFEFSTLDAPCVNLTYTWAGMRVASPKKHGVHANLEETGKVVMVGGPIVFGGGGFSYPDQWATTSIGPSISSKTGIMSEWRGPKRD